MESQLRNQSSTLKDAVATSRHLALLITGEQGSSVNLTVAKEALKLAKRQLGEDDRRSFHERHAQPGINPRSSAISPTTSDNSSPRPGPEMPPSPPPSPPLGRTSTSQYLPPSSTRHTDRRMATDIANSGAWVFPSSEGAASNEGVRLRSQANHPMATEINTGIRDRSARNLELRAGGGSRVRDQEGNIVWRERHHGNG